MSEIDLFAKPSFSIPPTEEPKDEVPRSTGRSGSRYSRANYRTSPDVGSSKLSRTEENLEAEATSSCNNQGYRDINLLITIWVEEYPSGHTVGIYYFFPFVVGSQVVRPFMYTVPITSPAVKPTPVKMIYPQSESGGWLPDEVFVEARKN